MTRDEFIQFLADSKKWDQDFDLEQPKTGPIQPQFNHLLNKRPKPSYIFVPDKTIELHALADGTWHLKRVDKKDILPVDPEHKIGIFAHVDEMKKHLDRLHEISEGYPKQ